jgi:hypothetical protein
MLRAATIAYLALGGFTLLYVGFAFAVTDRGVLGPIMAAPVVAGLWCLAMGAWSTWMAKRKARVPWPYGVVGIAVAVGVGTFTSTLALVFLLVPALLGAAATWTPRTDAAKL